MALGILTTYGNGTKKLYIPNNQSHNYAPYRPLTGEEREQENKRLRSVKTRQNMLQRGLSSANYNYFITLTTDNVALALNPKALLTMGNRFFKKESKGGDYFLALEAFYNANKGFHLHALSQFPINLNKWAEVCGSNKDFSKNIILNELSEQYYEQFYLKNNGNLYCEKLKFLNDLNTEYLRLKAIGIAFKYITKKVNITKERMEELYPNEKVRVYASNVKKINKEVEILDLDDDLVDDFLNDDLDFGEFLLNQLLNNTDTSPISDDEGFSSSAYKGKCSKSVLKVRDIKNKPNTKGRSFFDCTYFYINCLNFKPYTKGSCSFDTSFNIKESTIFEFLLKFIGYIFNIPEFFKII